MPMLAERDDDALTSAEEILVRVLTEPIVEDVIAEGLAASTPKATDSGAADAEHEKTICR
jgi:hypothetical protein